MKKIFVILAFVFGLILPANANVMPYYTNSINTNSIGVYQASNNIRVYKEPNENSPLVLYVNWDKSGFDCPDVSASNLFVAFWPKKDLAFLTVVDENDGEDWVQIVYNKNGPKLGWVKKDDQYKFMSWRTFINLYGRKYGLYYMKDAPEEAKAMYGTNAEDAKQISKITLAQTVRVTAINGNWALIIAVDIDNMQKIGWVKWRDISGKIYMFPDIK